mmetsp:Transcript_26010/g.71638  ORF Transcript_26010/g.71638 Transcript_26010/m.71638 type:complete len:581 (+) Transcript_26010:146-1888(+)
MQRRYTWSMVLLVAMAFVKGQQRNIMNATVRRGRERTGALFSSLAGLLSQSQLPKTAKSSRRTLLRPTFLTTTSTINEFSTNETEYDFDYFVIGAGSGGIASARRASAYGKRVALVESGRIGGTCVNVGCVPKKVMWNAARIAETVHDMSHYGFSGLDDISFDWRVLKEARDMYIQRLNRIYDINIKNSGIAQISGHGYFEKGEKNHVKVKDPDGSIKSYTAKHILIAVGGTPVIPEGEGIIEHSITSDGFFDLEEQPRKAVVVGGGYIAVEIAGVLQALGTDCKLVIRQEYAMRNLDAMLKLTLDEEMQRQGIEIFRYTDGLDRVELDRITGLKTVHLKNGEIIDSVDTVLVAPGRRPNVDSLRLEEAGVEVSESGHIVIDEYSETTADGIYAVGDVVGKVELTPVAIAAGRRLADRLFGGEQFVDAKVSYDLVPTVIFSHPTIGTVGMTEEDAKQKYGEQNVKVYKSKFANIYYGPWQVEQQDKPKTAMKLVCVGEEELVVGLHVIGMGADEMLQGFGVALKMGATKADLDATVAIHPTAAEEFVTMFPWGLSRDVSGAKQSPLNGSSPPRPTSTTTA